MPHFIMRIWNTLLGTVPVILKAGNGFQPAIRINGKVARIGVTQFSEETAFTMAIEMAKRQSFYRKEERIARCYYCGNAVVVTKNETVPCWGCGSDI